MEDRSSGLYNILLIVLLAVIAGSNTMTALNRGGATVTVVGESSISVKPTEFSMIVTRATLGDTADEAITQGEVAMNKLIDLIKRMAGNDTEIKKSFYQVTPQSGGSYVMASAVSVKSKNVAAAGNLIKFLYANGATTVSNVTFSPENQSGTDEQARTAALKDAKIKAEGMAKTMNKKLGRIVSMVDNNNDTSSSVSQGVYSGTDISNISLDRKVSVVYEIR